MRSEPAERVVPSSPPTLAQAVARLAAAQHGVVRHEQLIALGVGRSTIGRWVQSERLHVVHHKVYAVGVPLLPPLGADHAAVLAVATWDPELEILGDAALSHQTAGLRQQLLRASTGPIHVTSVRRSVPDGARTHTVRSLDPRFVTSLEGVPITKWFRTLIDLAEVLPLRELVRALEQSVIHDLYDHGTLVEAMRLSTGRAGLPALREALAAGHHLDPQMTRSILEEQFLFLVREADPALPCLPRMNADVRLSRGEQYEIDALFRRPRVAIELDSRFHEPSGARMRDAERDRALKRDGYRVFRFRWADVVGRPGWVLWQLRELLAPRG